MLPSICQSFPINKPHLTPAPSTYMTRPSSNFCLLSPAPWASAWLFTQQVQRRFFWRKNGWFRLNWRLSPSRTSHLQLKKQDLQLDDLDGCEKGYVNQHFWKRSYSYNLMLAIFTSIIPTSRWISGRENLPPSMNWTKRCRIWGAQKKSARV